MRQRRLVRAASASSIATLLAAVSHTLAGGPAPHPLLVLAVACLLVGPAALLIGTRPSRRRVALTVVLSQVVFHVLFQVLGSPVGGTVAGSPHNHHVDPAALAATSPGPIAEVGSPDALMILGHLGAAAVTTVLLWHGESMARAIARWVRARLRPAARCVPPTHTRPSVPALDTPLSPMERAVGTCTRRGPPVFA